MRTWMKLIPAVLLAIPFTWSPLRAADDATDQKIKKLQDDVAQMRKDLESLREEVRTSSARGAKVAEDLQDIKNMLRDMNREASIRRYGPSSLVPGVPPSIPPGAAIPPTATVTVQNTYSAAATVRINGQSYRLAPGQTLPVLMPTGTIQYSVDVDGFGTVEQLRTDTLPATGYRITIYPRMPLVQL
jgi:hypothetical protein